MKNPEKSEVVKKVERIKKKVEKLLNKGVLGKSPLRLEETLESHQTVKVLLEELDYTLSMDIPEEMVLNKISNIEKELNLMLKQSER